MKGAGLMRERPNIDPRTAVGVAVAVIVAVVAVVAVPSAMAAKPIRTVFTPEPFTFLAGEGCAFDVTAVPDEDARVVRTEFDDGRVMTQGHVNATLTNLETGASIVTRSRDRIVDTPGPVANEVSVEISGQLNFSFLPGDVGPFGLVGEPGLLLHMAGHHRFTVADTGRIVDYSFSGRTTDICALLSD
jgi:hypothetical protein